MTTATVPMVTVEPEAREHAETLGLAAAFDHMVEVTARVVPDLRAVRVTLQPDVDRPGESTLVWRVRMGPASRDAYRAAYAAWRREFAALAHDRPGFPIFGLDLVDE